MGSAHPRAHGKTKSSRTNYWRYTVANVWITERRARQSEAIQRWKPWERSTGPKSAEGKVKVSQNAFKGAERALLRKLARLLRACPLA